MNRLVHTTSNLLHRTRTRITRWAAFTVVAAALLATTQCNSSGTRNVATGATCPTTSTLTYDNFGRAFMDTYCVSCHSGQERPDLTTLAKVKAASQEVMLSSAAGPNGSNTWMPEDQDVTDAERIKLGEWLACGAP